MPKPKEEKQSHLELKEPDDTRTSGVHISYWLDSTDTIEYSELDSDIKVDTVIVGGGIVGVTTAYLLSRKGIPIALVDDGCIGSGETGRTTAHLVNALDDRYFDLEDYFGEDGAKKAAESHTAAINTIEGIIRSENIDCDFERLPGYLFLHPTDKKESLENEYQATRKAGIKTKLVEGVPGIPIESGPCLVFPDQAMLHPLKYLKGLCQVIENYGGRIFTKTHALEIDSKGIKAGNGHRIKANNVVVATNTPINDKLVIHTKQAPYRTYVIAALVPKDSLPHALWWDTGDQDSTWTNYPYHYIRLQNYDNDNDLIIIGGEDHKTGQAEKENIPEGKRYKELEDWSRKRFPMMGEILYNWSGQCMEPVDSLAFIGKNPADDDNVFIATGDSGNGMTHGTIAGILLSDLITKQQNDWAELYNPSRKTIKAAEDFLVEQTNVVEQYTDYLTGSDIDDVKELKPGSGAIVRQGLTKIAVYRDLSGSFHAFSAVCPHMKCIIKWNDDEKTFDCPCHGSRFTCFGKNVNGPAPRDLDEADVPWEK